MRKFTSPYPGLAGEATGFGVVSQARAVFVGIQGGRVGAHRAGLRADGRAVGIDAVAQTAGQPRSRRLRPGDHTGHRWRLFGRYRDAARPARRVRVGGF